MEIDLIAYNGHIISCDDRYKDKTAILVHNGFFFDVISDVSLEKISARQVINLEGRTIIPGLFDAHTHLLQYGLAKSLRLDLSNVSCGEEFINEIAIWKDERPTEWIYAFGWDESKWKDHRKVTIEEFDAVTGNVPSIATRIDGHTSLVNSSALTRLNVPVDDSRVEKDADGRPTGYLKDMDISNHIPVPTKKQYDDAIRISCRAANSLGITSVCDVTGAVDPENTTFQESIACYFRNKGELTVRISLYPSTKTVEQLFSCGIGPIIDDFLSIAGQKLFLDGSFGSNTAAISKGYIDGSHGLDLNPDAGKMVKRATEMGWQSAIHAIGDTAINRALDIIESAGVPYQRIEHAEYLEDEFLERVVSNKIVLSMQPNFNQWGFKGGLYDSKIGDDRTKLNPLRKVLDSGIILAFGSDCMPLDPWLGIFYAVNHPVSEQSITVIQAIKAYTIGSATAAGVDDLRGSITPGKLADFVILDRNPLTTEPGRLKEIKALKTFVGGKQVYPLLSTK
ncbi:MAG: amidohydrolase [Candidatus Hodarchaeales archaeon]